MQDVQGFGGNIVCSGKYTYKGLEHETYLFIFWIKQITKCFLQ